MRIAVWSDEHIDWGRSPVTVVRAAWDYPQRFAEFRSWLDRVERKTRLINDPAIVRWNVHKRYLAELAALGIAIAPTVFVAKDDDLDLAEICRARGWTDVVLKPCVSGSSFGAARMQGAAIAAAGVAHARGLQQLGDVMVQPYIRSIEDEGERAYIFIGGAFSHAVRKVPFSSSTVTTGEELHVPPQPELDFARSVLGVLREQPAYARVDVVPTADGPVLMELELVEPTLYFEFEPRAAQRLADLVLRDC